MKLRDFKNKNSTYKENNFLKNRTFGFFFVVENHFLKQILTGICLADRFNQT